MKSIYLLNKFYFNIHISNQSSIKWEKWIQYFFGMTPGGGGGGKVSWPNKINLNNTYTVSTIQIQNLIIFYPYIAWGGRLFD